MNVRSAFPLALAVAFASALTACGGGGSSVSAPIATATPMPNGGVLFVASGTSVTLPLTTAGGSIAFNAAGTSAASITFGPASTAATFTGTSASGTSAATTTGLPSFSNGNASAPATALLYLSFTSNVATTISASNGNTAVLTLTYPAGTVPTGKSYYVAALQPGTANYLLAISTGSLTTSGTMQTLTFPEATPYTFAPGTTYGFVVYYQ
jgi:hypothetical protein